MYNSLKSWINIPVTIKPFKKRLGNGDKEYGEAFSVATYPVHELKIVRNKDGVEITSTTHFYIDGDATVNELDEAIFEGRAWPVQAVSTFYRGGKPDVKVVYL